MNYRTVGALVLLLLPPGLAPARQTTVERGASPPPLVATKGKANGAVLAPGRTVKLKVRVADRSNRPLAGVTVLFVAPGAGPGGTFQDGTRTATATTNAKGLATAKLTANATPGPYLVSAVVERRAGETVPASLTFAMTNAAASSPALTASRARAAVHEQLLAEATLDETLKLHGPVLLPAGALVEAFGSADDLYPSEPFTTARASWLFWIDELPGAAFVHPTRFVVVDATDASPDLEAEARVTREGWWPRITLPGGAAPVDLLPASDLAAALDRPPVERASEHDLARMPAMDACAVVVCGPPNQQFQYDAALMVDFFRTGLRVPHVLSNGPSDDLPHVPATKGELFGFLQTAAMMNPACKKLFLYVAAHSNATGFELDTDPPTGPVAVSYTELADEIERLFRAKGTEICVILTGCQSGAAVSVFQDRGLRGTIVTAANRVRSALLEMEERENPTPADHFGRALRTAWRSTTSDADGDGHVTLEEAFANRGDDPLVNFGIPQIAPIRPINPLYLARDVVVQRPTETVTLNLPRPFGAGLGPSTLRVTVADPTVAVFIDAAGREVSTLVVEIRDPARPTTVTVKGLVDGVTSYTVTYTDDEQITYEGQATIRVGSGYGVVPNPIRVRVDETRSGRLARGGIFEHVPHPTPVLVTSANPAVAGPAQTTLLFAPFAGEATFPVHGVTAGLTSFVITDLVHGVTLTVPVEVVAEKCVLFEGTIPCETGDRMDPCGHHDFVGLTTFDLDVSVGDGGVVTLSGSNPQKCPASGAIDPATCAITTGECQATVAGFPNVRNQWRNVVFSVSTDTVTVTGQYAMGIGGELPGGCPIVYDFSGSAPLPKRGRER
jgi:hypothetical protein